MLMLLLFVIGYLIIGILLARFFWWSPRFEWLTFYSTRERQAGISPAEMINMNRGKVLASILFWPAPVFVVLLMGSCFLIFVWPWQSSTWLSIRRVWFWLLVSVMTAPNHPTYQQAKVMFDERERYS